MQQKTSLGKFISGILAILLALCLPHMKIYAQTSNPVNSIDFENEMLTGFNSYTPYTISYNGKVDFKLSSEAGSFKISPEEMFGEEVTITNHSNPSETVKIFIPSRPVAPVPGKTDETAQGNDGTITNVSSAMEYSINKTDWTACGGSTIEGLSPGTYYIRIKAVNGQSFSSESAEVIISSLEIPKSGDATLAALALYGIALAPGFDPSITFYAADVDNSVDLINVILDVTDQNATAKINGRPIFGQTTSDPISLNPGQNTISIVVTAENGNTKAYTIAINRAAAAAVSVSGITLNQSATAITAGATVRLYANISPPDATDKAVLWSSSNPAVATVSNNGIVSGVSAGSSIVTATASDGGWESSCIITVTKPVPVIPEATVQAEADDTDDIYYPAIFDDNDDNDETPPSSDTAPSVMTASDIQKAAASAVQSAIDSGAQLAAARFKNPGDISLETLQNIAGMSDIPLVIRADSLSPNGKSVDVRISLDPSKATDNLNLSASTTSPDAVAVQDLFTKWFDNTVSVISFGQQGSFGQDVEIAAKVDPELNKENLIFYAYDKQSNSYVEITSPNYWIDANGYVHFTTAHAGDIIITDKPLRKK